MYPRVGEKRRIDDINIEDEEAIGSLCRLGGRPLSPKTAMEQEKRIRREIANSNERRRMQSINAGFASLKTLLPHHEGEKLSKAAILQQTAEYIYQLEQEKTRLLSQNSQLKRLVNQQHANEAEISSPSDSPNHEERIIATAEPVQEVRTTITTTQIHKPHPTSELIREDLVNRMAYDRKQHRIKMEEHHSTNVREVEVGDTYIEEQIVECQPPVEKRLKREEPIFMETLSAMEHTYVEHLPQEVQSAPQITLETPTNLCTSNTIVRSRHPTTIVTVMPPPTNGNNIHTSVPVMNEVNESEIPTTLSEEQLANHTVYILNPSNSPCQKSLDTICEAIRHLEGEHMFPADEQQPSIISRVEEEVVTEDTHLTLHMIEPQEVPLELTTTHRGAEQQQPPHQQYITTHHQQNPTPLLSHSSRPGVIVVKHS